MRHTWMILLLAVAIIGLSLPGCSDKSKTEPGAAAPQELTIFSWWTAGGEADGLNELIKLFEAKNPNVKVVNAAVAGGAGSNAKAVLKTRMLGGDAPGTFQVHGGAELIDTWVKAQYMAPITALFNEDNLGSKFPPQLLDMVGSNGMIYAVPANIHRSNNIWYNLKIFQDNGLEAPKTLDEWLAACAKLKQAGITPIALASRDSWPLTHLFESLLVAVGGVDFYNDLFAGKIAWDDPKVMEALSTLEKLVAYANTDHSTLTWDQACGLVSQGKAAMTVMGDWAKGFFMSQGQKPGVEFGAAPTPGTIGTFIVVTDTFGLPAKAPNPELTIEFLRVVASIEGQVNVNLKKGSIPAR
nr:ABC transporter substrate-binding protein [bacterium]